jgi:cytochrome c peroxidase
MLRLWDPAGVDDPKVRVGAATAAVRQVEAYRPLVEAAFPGRSLEDLEPVDVAGAIAAYLRAVNATESTPWDRWLAGNPDAISDDAKRGAVAFFGDAGCTACHTGPSFSDGGVHAIGVPQVGPGYGAGAPEDRGAEESSGRVEERYAFRTPRLRNVLISPPYGHDGALLTLDAAIRHHLDPAASLKRFDVGALKWVKRTYDARQPAVQLQDAYGDADARLAALVPHLDPLLPARSSSISDDEVKHLVAFLSTLTDPKTLQRAHLPPDNVPSGLPINSSTSVSGD